MFRFVYKTKYALFGLALSWFWEHARHCSVLRGAYVVPGIKLGSAMYKTSTLALVLFLWTENWLILVFISLEPNLSKICFSAIFSYMSQFLGFCRQYGLFWTWVSHLQLWTCCRMKLFAIFFKRKTKCKFWFSNSPIRLGILYFWQSVKSCLYYWPTHHISLLFSRKWKKQTKKENPEVK